MFRLQPPVLRTERPGSGTQKRTTYLIEHGCIVRSTPPVNGRGAIRFGDDVVTLEAGTTRRTRWTRITNSFDTICISGLPQRTRRPPSHAFRSCPQRELDRGKWRYMPIPSYILHRCRRKWEYIIVMVSHTRRSPEGPIR